MLAAFTVQKTPDFEQKGWRPSLFGWRPPLAGWRPSLFGWRPLLLGWRPSAVGWRPSLVVSLSSLSLLEKDETSWDHPEISRVCFGKCPERSKVSKKGVQTYNCMEWMHTHTYIYIVYVFFSACFCGGVSFCDTRIVFVVFLALATAGSYIKHTHTKLYIVRCHVVDW